MRQQTWPKSAMAHAAAGVSLSALGETFGIDGLLAGEAEASCHGSYPPHPRTLHAMSAILTSTLVVAVAEIGDKTQLLSLMLAARFRRPWPIVLGIFVATIANHYVAAWVGDWAASAIGPNALRWLLGGSFLAIALWALRPDELDGAETGRGGMGVFATAVVAFFLAEIGYKTQVATIALAAKYTELAAVVTGTTLGMMLANVPVVFLGERIVKRLPLRAVRWAAAAIFTALGVAVLLGLGG